MNVWTRGGPGGSGPVGAPGSRMGAARRTGRCEVALGANGLLPLKNTPSSLARNGRRALARRRTHD